MVVDVGRVVVVRPDLCEYFCSVTGFGGVGLRRKTSWRTLPLELHPNCPLTWSCSAQGWCALLMRLHMCVIFLSPSSFLPVSIAAVLHFQENSSAHHRRQSRLKDLALL